MAKFDRPALSCPGIVYCELSAGQDGQFIIPGPNVSTQSPIFYMGVAVNIFPKHNKHLRLGEFGGG